MEFFGLGAWEILLILLVALLVFGPNRLPEIGRTLGKAVREFRKTTSSMTAEVTRELERAESDAKLKELGSELKEIGAAVDPSKIVGPAVQPIAQELRQARQDLEHPPEKTNS